MKTRFAATVTGDLSLADARIAALNWLHAKAVGGKFLLRFADTEITERTRHWTTRVMTDLTWLGIDWDEGPYADESFRPFRQSERQARYQIIIDSLIEHDLAYYCFCDEKTLLANRVQQRQSGQPIYYPGTCRQLSMQEVIRRLSAGESHTVRCKVSTSDQINCVDGIRGEAEYKSSTLGDFIIRRSDGVATMLLANLVDDADMCVTDVIRPGFLFSQFPRLKLLADLTKLTLPNLSHCAQLVGNDEARLHSHNGGLSVAELREGGYCPQAVLAWLLAMDQSDVTEYRNPNQAAQSFSLSMLPSTDIKFSAEQGDYWQRKTLLQLTPACVWSWLGDEVKALIPTDKHDAFWQCVQANVERREQAVDWARRCFAERIDYTQEQLAQLRAFGITRCHHLHQLLLSHDSFSEFTATAAQAFGCPASELNLPLRLAWTGIEQGPELPLVFALMPTATKQDRLQQVIYHL